MTIKIRLIQCCSDMSWDKLASFLFLTMSAKIYRSLAPDPIWVMKGCWSNFLMGHLFLRSFSRHFSTKSHMLGEYFCLLSRHESLVEMKYMALSGGSLRYGGSPSISSISMTPADHTSTSSL